MDTKVCPKCKETKSVDDFSWRNKSRGTRQPWCKPCNRKYQKEHYRGNKEDYIKKAARSRKRARIRMQERLYEFLSDKSCKDCGISDPRVLQFDHVRGTKESNISNMVSNGTGWDRILKEIKKCEVRCANCHAIVTAERAGWAKSDW